MNCSQCYCAVPPWAVHPASLSPTWPCSIPVPGQALAHTWTLHLGCASPVSPGVAACRSLGQNRVRRSKCTAFTFLTLQLRRLPEMDVSVIISFGFVCCALDQILLEWCRFSACVTSFGTKVHEHVVHEPLPSRQLLWISLLLFLFDTS